MNIFKKISIVYTLQVLVVIVLFYPGAAQETALTGNTAVKKQKEYATINSNYFPIAAGPALFLNQLESDDKEFYFLSSLIK